MTPSDRRRSILERIASFICRDRQNTYGDAEDNFRDIADRWGIYVRRRFKVELSFSPEDVAAMMIDLKLARIATSPAHQDNWDDAAGYAVCGAGICEAANYLAKEIVDEQLSEKKEELPTVTRCVHCNAAIGAEHGAQHKDWCPRPRP